MLILYLQVSWAVGSLETRKREADMDLAIILLYIYSFLIYRLSWLLWFQYDLCGFNCP